MSRRVCAAALAILAVGSTVTAQVSFQTLGEIVTLATVPTTNDDTTIQGVLDRQLGLPRTVITFDDQSEATLYLGQQDTRFVRQGVIFEVVQDDFRWGVVVSGNRNSGPISGVGLMLQHGGQTVRVHFVSPTTYLPTTVNAAGLFTSTPDRTFNCVDYYSPGDALLGSNCMTNPAWSPTTEVEFLGGASETGIAYIDIRTWSFPFEVDFLAFSAPTIEDRTENAISEVVGLVETGVLTGGQGNALIGKLEDALKKLNRGKTKPALNKLNAFINQVTDLIDNETLTQGQGDALIAAAQAIIDQIENG